VPHPATGARLKCEIVTIGLTERLRRAGCVFAEEEAELLRAAAGDPAELESMVSRRVAGEPLELVVGWAEFCGERISVSPGVFVPRRRSELLARGAVLRTPVGATVVDLCCGTGALGLVVARAVDGITLHATDLDPAAVAVARANLLPVHGHVHEGDLFDALPRSLAGRVDVIVVNAPYVPTAEIGYLPAEARDHEHRIALDGGSDGLDLHRRIAAESTGWLSPGGCVLIETSRRQQDGTAAAFGAAGLRAEIVQDDDLAATIVVAYASGIDE